MHQRTESNHSEIELLVQSQQKYNFCTFNSLQLRHIFSSAILFHILVDKQHNQRETGRETDETLSEWASMW